MLPMLLLIGCQGDEGAPGDGPTGGDPPETEVLRDPRFDGIADVLRDELAATGAEAASIAVMEGGELTWAEGFGFADLDREVAVTADTVFQIGSITKQMTAAVVLQQVEDGTLSLDTPMSELLPSFTMTRDPTWAPSANLHLLLSNQGGLYDTLDWEGAPDDELLADWHYSVYGPLYFPMVAPGSFYNYSNVNFTLAGLAAETHDPAGRWFPDLLAEDLFAPLGMSRTFVRKDDVTGDGDFAVSVADDETGQAVDVPMRQVPDPASARPAGLVWSTPSDLCTWGRFLMHGDPDVLDDALRTEITSPQVSLATFDDHASYGYGEVVWDLYPLSDGWYPMRVWEHDGATLSFSSWMQIFPDDDVVIAILLAGRTSGGFFPETNSDLTHEILDLPPPVPYVLEVDPEGIAVHVGTYSDPFNVGDIVISEDGDGGLVIDLPLLTELGFAVDPILQPRSTDRWTLHLDDLFLDLTFIRDPDGGPTPWVRTRPFVGARADAATSRIAAPTPDRDRLRRMLAGP